MVVRYCGNCGKKITKPKKPCLNCEIKIDKYKKPYKKLTFELKIILVIAILIVVGIEITIFQLYELNMSSIVNIGIFICLIVVPIYLILYSVIKYIYRLKSIGFRQCTKCNKKVALNAKYCIYCGKKINWSLYPVLKEEEKNPSRTIKNITITGGKKQAVKNIIDQWIDDCKITVVEKGSEYIKGRIGSPEGKGLVAPKYFEITYKTTENKINVHIEGYVSIKMIGKPAEWNFAPRGITAGIPRKQGWKAINDLANRLDKTSTS